MNAADEKARRLIDSLADHVKAPAPPAHVGTLFARRRRAERTLAVALVAIGLAGGAALLGLPRLRGPAPAVTGPAAEGRGGEAAALVIVERLRLHGRDALPRLTAVPGAGAVVVTSREERTFLGEIALGLFPEAWAGEEPVGPAGLHAGAEASYHVRLLRALVAQAPTGSALFGTHEFVIPLSERERWGRADQSEALRAALGATRIETLPGLVIRSGNAADGDPHRFETALGETLVDVAFEAEPIEGGWHRIRISAAGPLGPAGDFLDAELRVADGATVALAAPLGGEGDTLVIGVTPLAPGSPHDFGTVSTLGGDDVKPPVLREMVHPVYPERAKEERLTGKVIMDLVVRMDGTPDRLVVLQMPEGGEWLAGAAAEAVSKWRWDPATRADEPIDVYMTLVVDFQLR
ncbi:MAG: energy transducer TonB [Acidobacteria bacterium]|nr:energy transducer TonB [Acidobacteriota bacterium]